MGSSFADRVDRFLSRPELQKVFDEARGLAKDAGSKTRIDEARDRLLCRHGGDDGRAPRAS